MKKKLGIKGNTHLLLPEVDRKIKRAYKRYRTCKRNATELRLNYQESLAQAMAEEGNQSIKHKLSKTSSTGRKQGTCTPRSDIQLRRDKAEQQR